jgi:hypothetical protein
VFPDNATAPLEKNLELNVLAVAVANLADGPAGQEAAQPTIDDLFNTFVAAFTSAKDHNVGTLNTGSIGTGVFANSTTVVYVMQKLAAMHVGINLRYYGVDKKTPQKDLDATVNKVVDAYTKSQTHTVKHLLELAHDILK